MRRNGKITVLALFSLLFVMLFAQAAWAETEEGNGAPDKAVLMSVSGSDEHSDGTGVHQDPATFQKNYCLSYDQKKGTYTVKVKVKAAGKGTYKASAWKYVTIKIKVK